jgi:hypothetical protein
VIVEPDWEAKLTQMIYDPSKAKLIKKRLSLQGNPAMKEDWWKNPKSG